MSVRKRSSQTTSSGAPDWSERLHRGGREFFHEQFRQLISDKGKSDEPMGLEPATGCLAIILITVGFIVLVLGIALALGEMSGRPDKMATDLPWGKHALVWLLGAFVIGLLGLVVLGVARARSEKAALVKDPHLYQSKKLEKHNEALEDEIERFSSDPVALDSLSNEELQHRRIVIESMLERCEREFTDEEKEFLTLLNTPQGHHVFTQPIVGKLYESKLGADKARKKQERIDDLKLLLKLVVSKQDQRIEHPSPPAPPQPLTPVQQRQELLDEIHTRRSEKAAAINRLKASDASEDEIRRYENMYDNAIDRLERKLQELLLK